MRSHGFPCGPSGHFPSHVHLVTVTNARCRREVLRRAGAGGAGLVRATRLPTRTAGQPAVRPALGALEPRGQAERRKQRAFILEGGSEGRLSSSQGSESPGPPCIQGWGDLEGALRGPLLATRVTLRFLAPETQKEPQRQPPSSAETLQPGHFGPLGGLSGTSYRTRKCGHQGGGGCLTGCGAPEGLVWARCVLLGARVTPHLRPLGTQPPHGAHPESGAGTPPPPPLEPHSPGRRRVPRETIVRAAQWWSAGARCGVQSPCGGLLL